MKLFLNQYEPKHSSQIIGQEAGMHKLKHFLTNYKELKGKFKAALVHGPLGTGKTSAVYALASELDMDILEINSSNKRNKANIDSFLSAAMGQMSLFMKPKLILIDEVDNFSGRYDRGGTAQLIKALSKSQFPVICTANDPSDSKLKGLRKISMMVEFDKIPYENMLGFLTKIKQEQHIQIQDSALSALVRQSDGDMRSALIDLQTLAGINTLSTLDDITSLGDRKRTTTIINALRIVFKSSSAKTAKEAFRDIDVDMDKLFLWLEKNIAKEYFKPQELQKAYEYLARADVYRGRIRRWQHWRFMVYIFDLLSAGISTAKIQRNPDFVKYEESRRLLKIWMSKMKFGKRNDIADHLAKHSHTSKKRAIQMMPFIKKTFQNSTPDIQNDIANELELDQDHILWLKKP
ncbi:replication factor C large subunit [archaeon]|jgi:replication factor C large subunit|nr:replication factor C large subunit [archaeon]MBT6697958.1 replication factor C large subunit [archaeon]